MRTRSAAGLPGLLVFVLLAATAAPAAAQDGVHVEEEGGDVDVHSAPPIAQRLFHDIVCMCGGCKRETLYKCTCGYARQERGKVMAILAEQDLSTPEGEEKAYDAVIAAFMQEYGGQHVLTVPLDKGFNKLMWIVPYLVFPLALLMVFMIARGWVRRGRLETAEAMAGGGAAGTGAVSGLSQAKREELEDRLDDELRDID